MNRLPKCDAREFLLNRFAELQAKNPAYSLRSFARTLQISPASVSQILSGKRPVTLTTAKKICDRLSLSPLEEKQVIQSLLAGLASAEPHAASAAIQLATDQFKVISDWQHFAILSLTQVKGSKPDAGWVAKRLGISVIVAQESMDRLKRLGLLTVSGSRWREKSPAVSVNSTVPNSAIRKFHRQILEKAIESLEKDSVEDREFGARTLAICPERLDEARQIIRRFREELSQVLERGSDRRVYVLMTNLFPLEIKGEVQ